MEVVIIVTIYLYLIEYIPIIIAKIKLIRILYPFGITLFNIFGKKIYVVKKLIIKICTLNKCLEKYATNIAIIDASIINMFIFILGKNAEVNETSIKDTTVIVSLAKNL